MWICNIIIKINQGGKLWKKSLFSKTKKAIKYSLINKRDSELLKQIDALCQRTLPYVFENNKQDFERFYEKTGEWLIEVRERCEKQDPKSLEREMKDKLGLLNNLSELLIFQAEEKPNAQTLINKMEEKYPKGCSAFVECFCEYSKDPAELYKKCIIEPEEVLMAEKIKRIKEIMSGQQNVDNTKDDDKIIMLSDDISRCKGKLFHCKYKLKDFEERSESANAQENAMTLN